MELRTAEIKPLVESGGVWVMYGGFPIKTMIKILQQTELKTMINYSYST